MKRKNAGYSLVELVIVLGIIAVLSGLAAVTISAITTARATSAKESFNEELSTLQTMTKSQNKDSAILIEKVDGKYHITYGTFTGDVTRKEDGNPSDDFKNRSKFTADTSKDTVTLDRVKIMYAAKSSETAKEVTEVNGTAGFMIIMFDKADGSVLSGEGVYTFNKEHSDVSVGKVTLNKMTGSHYTGS